MSGYASVNGVRIWYGIFGTGRPVILLEGGEDAADDWSLLVPVLVRHGYRAIIIDTRCQGRSTCSPQPLDYHLFAEDMIGAVDHLGIHTGLVRPDVQTVERRLAASQEVYSCSAKRAKCSIRSHGPHGLTRTPKKDTRYSLLNAFRIPGRCSPNGRPERDCHKVVHARRYTDAML